MIVYVLTWQGDDPFVAGGVPVGAFTSERDAWDRAAEMLAESLARVWSGDLRHLRGSQTQLRVAAGIAQGYEVFPLELDG